MNGYLVLAVNVCAATHSRLCATRGEALAFVAEATNEDVPELFRGLGVTVDNLDVIAIHNGAPVREYSARVDGEAKFHA